MTDLAISIDLGGTQIRAAIIDRSGQILAKQTVATNARAGADQVTDQIADLAGSVAQDFAANAIIGVGVSSPGPLDTTRGMALSLPTISGFENYPLREVLTQKLGTRVQLENDGIAAAIGEWRFGAGLGLANIVYVTVSTGIGGGIIAGNQVLRGRHGMAGHVGHMSFLANGAACPCGNYGCFEAYGSGTAITQRAQVLGNGTTAKQVFEMAERGNRDAQKLIDEQAEILGQGFASLMHLYSPDVLIMGGGMSAQFLVLKDGIESARQKSAMPAFRDIPILPAQLGDNSGLLGAASLVFE